MALTHTPPPDLGQSCPEFNLPATDGRTYDLKMIAEGARALLVMFICNHCPYVIAVEDRIVALAGKFQPLGVRFVAISSNDVVRYPADSLENMAERAREKDYSFPYLLDESQDVARAFGAVCTPDFFLFDSALKLAYRGRLDDSWKDPSLVRQEDLKGAMELLLEGRTVPADQKSSMGCSIKWKGV